MGSSLWVLSSPDIIWGRLGTLCLGIQTCENGEVHCLNFSGPKPCEVPEFTTRRWSLWERTTNQWVETSFGFWGPLHAIWWFEKSATVNGCFSENWKDPVLWLQLPRPAATAGRALEHSINTFQRLYSANKPMTFKFGLTHDASVRFHNRRFGYVTSKDPFDYMLVLYATSNSHGAAFLEAALINQFKRSLIAIILPCASQLEHWYFCVHRLGFFVAIVIELVSFHEYAL